MTIHKSITEERIIVAVESRMFGLENPGFCIACGADHYSCEPDAQNYECEDCGERQVFGAEEIMMTMC